MTSLHRRLQRIEAVLRPIPKPGSDPSSVMQGLALALLSTEDLRVLCDMTIQGKMESTWNKLELRTAKAFASAFEQQIQLAGYRSIREFQDSLK